MSHRRVVFAALLVASCWCLSTIPPATAVEDLPPPPPDRGSRLFPARVQCEYEFLSSVLVDGSSRRVAADDGSRSPVGHRVVGRLSVANLWSAARDDDDKLLRLHVSTVISIDTTRRSDGDYMWSDVTRLGRGTGDTRIMGERDK